jgi:hypothetical protein
MLNHLPGLSGPVERPIQVCQVSTWRALERTKTIRTKCGTKCAAGIFYYHSAVDTRVLPPGNTNGENIQEKALKGPSTWSQKQKTTEPVLSARGRSVGEKIWAPRQTQVA